MAAPTPLPLVGAALGFAFSAAEGLVSKHRERPYQAGRSKHWVKVKNRKHPAM
jgi:ATP-dependent DNA ligase